MTVNKLHKLLGKLIAEGHGRVPVCVNKDTFTHPLGPDGAIILQVSGVIVASIEMLDDDGGMKTRKDGRQCLCNCVILFGESGEPSTGMTWEVTQQMLKQS